MGNEHDDKLTEVEAKWAAMTDPERIDHLANTVRELAEAVEDAMTFLQAKEILPRLKDLECVMVQESPPPGKRWDPSETESGEALERIRARRQETTNQEQQS